MFRCSVSSCYCLCCLLRVSCHCVDVLLLLLFVLSVCSVVGWGLLVLFGLFGVCLCVFGLFVVLVVWC